MRDSESYRTAITRKGPSVPARWLVAHTKVPCGPATLDFGCGKGEDADYFRWDRYDPHYAPDYPKRQYNFIVCTYVLNAVSLETQKKVTRDILDLLTPSGVAYVAVRRDFHKDPRKRVGKDKRITQRYVELVAPIVRSNHNYCIYEIRRKGDGN